MPTFAFPMNSSRVPAAISYNETALAGIRSFRHQIAMLLPLTPSGMPMRTGQEPAMILQTHVEHNRLSSKQRHWSEPAAQSMSSFPRNVTTGCPGMLPAAGKSPDRIRLASDGQTMTTTPTDRAVRASKVLSSSFCVWDLTCVNASMPARMLAGAPRFLSIR